MKKGFILFLSVAALSLPSLATTYSGSDTACFYGLGKSSCTLTSSQSTLGSGFPVAPLSYTPGSSFSAPFPAGGTITLGDFSVAEDLVGAADGTFDINITFTAPAGAGGKTYSADASGLVIWGVGGAEITFNDPTTQLYTYPGGEFDLSLPSSTILVGAGCSDPLQATITPVPEPTFFAGFGGILLSALAIRRRQRARANQA